MASAQWTADEVQWLRTCALEAGFHSAGIAALEPGSQADDENAARFTSWIDAGFAGEMDYLKRRDEQGILLRSNVRIAMPWARSVIVCALNYNVPAPRSIDPAPDGSGWIARYAWSGRAVDGPPHASQATDYHAELLGRLKVIDDLLQQRMPCESRCYVDTGPLVERSVAEKAGIGWVGKNACIIDQQLGSWLLLAVIVTSVPVAAQVAMTVAADRCGSCTRCIDACPTDALIAPRQMDASRCISYLTIEKKGQIPEELRPHMGRQVFGCDICQDVCPWNRRAPVSVTEGMVPRPELINPALEWLGSMDGPDFNRWFRGSPLERTRRRRVQRNVAIAMGNAGDRRFLPQLEQWAFQTEDPVLADAAHWAVKRICPLEVDTTKEVPAAAKTAAIDVRPGPQLC